MVKIRIYLKLPTRFLSEDVSSNLKSHFELWILVQLQRNPLHTHTQNKSINKFLPWAKPGLTTNTQAPTVPTASIKRKKSGKFCTLKSSALIVFLYFVGLQFSMLNISTKNRTTSNSKRTTQNIGAQSKLRNREFRLQDSIRESFYHQPKRCTTFFPKSPKITIHFHCLLGCPWYLVNGL